jgi:hypothetical protein
MSNQANWKEFWIIFCKPNADEDEEIIYTIKTDSYKNAEKVANECQLVNEGYELAGIVKAAYISDVGYCLECYAMGMELELAKQKRAAQSNPSNLG